MGASDYRVYGMTVQSVLVGRRTHSGTLSGTPVDCKIVVELGRKQAAAERAIESE